MEYKRLTKRTKDGKVDYAVDIEDISVDHADMYEKALKQDELIRNRLAELEDKIENGTLIEAPCEDWDRKYFIVQERYTGKPTIVDTHHWEWYLRARLCGVWYLNAEEDTISFDYGKTMFDTYEEAEKRLKELQK